MTLAFSTDNPEAVAAYRAACDARTAFINQILDEAQQIGRNKGVLRSSSVMGNPHTLGLAPDNPDDPPPGWQYIAGKNRLAPSRGKAGDDAREWLAAHQPTTAMNPRRVLEPYGLPYNDLLPTKPRNGTHGINVPRLFEHEGVLWAMYEGTPATGWTTPAECTWMLRRQSEWWAAAEAYEAAHDTAGAVA